MTPGEGFEIGYFAKTQGTEGALVLEFNGVDPQNFKELDVVFLYQENQAVPFFIESFTINQQRALVKLEDINTPDQAAKLKGYEVLVHQHHLPEAERKNLALNKIIGFIVRDMNLGTLGEVWQLYRVPGNDLIAMHYQGREVLIPYTDEIVPLVDYEKQEVQVTLPDGLLDIYLEG